MATCGSALWSGESDGWCAVQEKALGEAESSHSPPMVLDGFCSCEDPQRKRVSHPRLDVSLFSRMCSSNSSGCSFRFSLTSSSVGSSAASPRKPSSSLLFPSLCLLTAPTGAAAAGDAAQVLFTLTTQR